MMFKSIAAFIQDKISPQQEVVDGQHLMHLAAAALLLEVSRADFDIQDEELEAIAAALQQRFDFTKEETQNLINLAMTEQDSYISIHSFVKIINSECSAEEKKMLLQDLWHIAYADNKLDKYEEYQIRKIADLLYLSHRDFIQTKLKVLESQGESQGKN
jgi:uncharacterized tellurite resistance protein B-like protein